MDWITPEIAIGARAEVGDHQLLRTGKFRSILNLDGTLFEKAMLDAGIERIESVRLLDSPGNEPAKFLRAVETLETLVSSHPPVLVQRHAGRSRSVVVVAGFLLRTGRFSWPADALQFIAQKREISVTPGVELLLDYL